MGFFNRKGASQQPQNQSIQLMMTADGVFVTQALPDGRFKSFPVKLTDKPGTIGGWAVGRGIDLDVSNTDGVCSLILRFVDAEGEHVVFRSPRQEEIAYVSALLRNAWAQAQAPMVACAPAISSAPMPMQQPQMATASYGAAYTPELPQGQISKGNSRWIKAALLGLAFVLVAGGSWAVATRVLKPSGPGVDLSAMTIEEVASMEANPAATQGVQDAMIEAMGYGRSKGAQQAAGMEEETIKTLESMGLVMGASMKNAMGCLAR